MLTRVLRHRLECLGWKTFGAQQAEDGSWFVVARSCGHTLVALANTENEVCSAACSLSLKLTVSDVARTSLEDLDERR
jgi:hypothetical protein